jgi:hypothetical protein
MWVQKTLVKTGSRSSPAHGASTSSTACPRPDSSSAASSTARSATGSSSASIGGTVVTPTRSRPGSRWAAATNGSAGADAQ